MRTTDTRSHASFVARQQEIDDDSDNASLVYKLAGSLVHGDGPDFNRRSSVNNSDYSSEEQPTM